MFDRLITVILLPQVYPLRGHLRLIAIDDLEIRSAAPDSMTKVRLDRVEYGENALR